MSFSGLLSNHQFRFCGVPKLGAGPLVLTVGGRRKRKKKKFDLFPVFRFGLFCYAQQKSPFLFGSTGMTSRNL